MRRLRLAIVTTLLATLGASPVHAADTTSATTTEPPAKYSIQLGYEQRVYGPTMHVDMPFYTVTDNGQRKTFIANGDTYTAPVSDGGAIGAATKVLPRGPVGRFDQCGAWMTAGVYANPGNSRHLISWYHAEKTRDPRGWCLWSNGRTRWSMGYAESVDGGHTWVKGRCCGQSPKYPANHVITQDTALLDSYLTEDAGNGRVVDGRDGYLYMLYMASTRESANRRLNIARAPKSSLGRPGSWKKYYCSTGILGTTCGFSQPGLGGRSTALKGVDANARHIEWSDYLQSWLAFSASGREGFRIMQSKDLVNWNTPRDIYPAVTFKRDPTVDKWGARTASDRSVYGYGSLARFDLLPGSLGQDGYLYYMKVYPGEGFDRRYLVRRKISFVPVSPQIDRVQLTTYVRPNGIRRTSTEMPNPDWGFRIEAGAGYLRTKGGDPNFFQLFECRLANGDSYLRQQTCHGGDAAERVRNTIRRVGWISPRRTDLATVQIWRCYDAARNRHFASTFDQDCFGAKKEFIIGYALSAIR